MRTSPTPPAAAGFEPTWYWISWYSEGPFEYHGPWWVTGSEAWGRERDTICAAVPATTEEEAQRVILAAHDDPTVTLEWRFAEPRRADWLPFSDRFPRAHWMRWPEVPSVGTALR